MIFKFFQKVQDPKNGRQLVIPDIHGCAKTFQALLRKIKLSSEDQLFLLGDYINRGPDNVGVIRTILELMEQGFKVYPLRGNHEQMALESHKNRILTKRKGEKLILGLQKRKGLLDKDGLLLPIFYDFFSSLPYYYELSSAFLVHAGFDFTDEHPFESWRDMLWIKDFNVDLTQTNNKKVIFGHVSHTKSAIEKAAFDPQQSSIGLDNGCYKKSHPEKGHLCCLDIQNQKLTWQKNID